MLKYITVCILICLCSISLGIIDLYRGCELVNLSNGIEVVFVNTNKTDYTCLTLCISNNNQFIEISEIIGRIFQKQIDNEINSNSAIYGTEIYPYYGFDQTLFSIYGKVEHVEQYIKILGKNFSGLSLSEEIISQIKEKMINELKVKNQNDKYNIRNEALRILYHNNEYGKIYSIDNIQKITNKDVKLFYNKNYSNNKIKLLITGNVDKKSIERLLIDCFKNKNSSSVNNQPVKEFNYRETSSKLTQFSSQVKVPLIELYWKTPSYKLEPIKAGALDIFCHYFLEELKKIAIHDLKIASSIELEHSLWNFTYGVIKICVILNPNLNIDDTITSLISNIRRITAENKDIEAARNELIVESDVFDYRANVIDTINWVSPKISSGYSFEFLRNYLQLIRSIKQEDIFKEAIDLFKKEPNVISILIPKEDKQKNVI